MDQLSLPRRNIASAPCNDGLLSFFPRAVRELIYLIFAGPCRFGRIAPQTGCLCSRHVYRSALWWGCLGLVTSISIASGMSSLANIGFCYDIDTLQSTLGNPNMKELKCQLVWVGRETSRFWNLGVLKLWLCFQAEIAHMKKLQNQPWYSLNGLGRTCFIPMLPMYQYQVCTSNVWWNWYPCVAKIMGADMTPACNHCLTAFYHSSMHLWCGVPCIACQFCTNDHKVTRKALCICKRIHI